MKYSKIYILGTSGSGKSTLANQISKILKIKTYDLDDIFWYKKYTKKRNIEKRREKLKQLIKGKRKWIIEGIYTDWSEEAIKKADLIIWISTPKHILSWRIFKRYLKRKGEKDETLKDCINLIKYARGYKKHQSSSGYESHKKTIKNHKKEVVILKNNRQIKKFLKDLE
jgi:adenylate kinase family enzyme